jgi:hypothetical protein
VFRGRDVRRSDLSEAREDADQGRGAAGHEKAIARPCSCEDGRLGFDVLVAWLATPEDQSSSGAPEISRG